MNDWSNNDPIQRLYYENRGTLERQSSDTEVDLELIRLSLDCSHLPNPTHQ